jgi:archaellum component FlaC
MWSSSSSVDKSLGKAKNQVSQHDIAQSLINAVEQLNHEVKRIAHDVERLRRDVQVSRRRTF